MEMLQDLALLAGLFVATAIFIIGLLTHHLWLQYLIKDVIARREFKVPYLVGVGIVGAIGSPRAGFALLAVGCAVHLWSIGLKIGNAAEAEAADEQLLRKRAQDAMREPGDWRP